MNNHDNAGHLIIAIDDLTATSADTPVEEVPAVPDLNPDDLHAPQDLRPLHLHLVEQATATVSRDGQDHYGNGPADTWLRAASQIHYLHNSWHVRMHAIAAHEVMRHDAIQSVTALLAGLRTDRRREQERWFSIAEHWCNHLRMQAEARHFATPDTPAPAPSDRASEQPNGLLARLANRLFGHPRPSTADSAPASS